MRRPVDPGLGDGLDPEVLLRRPHPARPATPLEAPLLERGEPEHHLGDALTSARSGKGRCAFLVAPAGLGKTALLDRAASSWRAEGLLLGHAVGSPMETEIPFGLLDRAVSMLGGADAIGEVSDVDRNDPGSSRLFRTMRWLEKACAEVPVLLALDDLHWSDGDSIELLGYLCRRIAQLPVAILGTLRPEPDRAGGLVEDLATTAGARLVSLAPLTRAGSSALAARILSREATEAESDAIWRGTGGVPLLVEAAADSLRRGTSVGTLDTVGRTGLRFVLERFAGVGEPSLSYATSAAIFGVRFRRSLASQLARLEEADGARAYDRLVRARLLEDLGGGWSRFVHPLFAQSLLDMAGPTRQEELHARAFRLLLDACAPDGEAAEHAYAGGRFGDPLAIEVAARAGQAAAALGAFEVASTHLAHAIELAGDRAPLPLRLAHAGVLVALTRTEQADRCCEDMLADPHLPTSARAEVLRLLAQGAFVANRPADAQHLFQQAAAAAGADPPAEGRGLLHAVLTCLPTSTVRWAEETAGRALGLVEERSPERSTCAFVHGYTRLLHADPASASDVEEAVAAWRAGTLAVESGSRWAVAFHVHGATKLLERYGDAAQVFEGEYHRARRDGSPLLMATMAISHADVLHRLGRTGEALGLVDESFALSDYDMAPWHDVARAALLSELDRAEEAGPHLAALHRFVSSVPRGFGAVVALWTDIIEARRLLDAGRPEQASDAMADAWALSEETRLRHPLVVPWWPVAVDAHLRAGRLGLAEALVDHIEGISRPLRLRWPTAVAALARAQLPGTPAEVDKRFEVAIGLHQGTDQPIHRAEALVAYGSHLRRTRRPVEARARLREAVGLAQSSGSPRVARLALAELAGAGGRRSRLRASPAELTAREHQVAELASEGRSNAEIAATLYLSVKTVEHHLGHVYQKLGISSRRALIGRRR